jgi:RNA polymerase sigma-70 factor, ECF subfamily
MLQDREEAEDAVQDSVLRAWIKLGTFRQGLLRPWFLTIVGNRCRSLRRSRKLPLLPLGNQTPVPSVEERVVQSLDLRRALMDLRHKDRVLVVLHFYLDLPFDEIAVVVGLRPAAVKARTYRAVRRLVPRLTEELAT